MNIFLAIDPSINNVGFAILQKDKWSGGTVTTDKEDSLLYRCEYIKREIGKELAYKPVQVVIEYPQFMRGTKGIVAAQQGYTIDLATICGYMAAAFGTAMSTTFYTPMQWKGTKPKTATEAAFRRSGIALLQKSSPSEHQIDATMLLHYHLKKKSKSNLNAAQQDA